MEFRGLADARPPATPGMQLSICDQNSQRISTPRRCPMEDGLKRVRHIQPLPTSHPRIVL